MPGEKHVTHSEGICLPAQVRTGSSLDNFEQWLFSSLGFMFLHNSLMILHHFVSNKCKKHSEHKKQIFSHMFRIVSGDIQTRPNKNQKHISLLSFVGPL